jgi:hypothetical protein
MSRTRKWPLSPSSPPVPTGSRSEEKAALLRETFLRRDDAHRWARQAETRVDQGLAPNKSSVSRLTTFGDLIDLHIIDMCEGGKSPRREPRPPRSRRSSAIWARTRSEPPRVHPLSVLLSGKPGAVHFTTAATCPAQTDRSAFYMIFVKAVAQGWRRIQRHAASMQTDMPRVIDRQGRKWPVFLRHCICYIP